MTRPPPRQLAVQASQRDRDFHRKPPKGGSVCAATGASHQPRRERYSTTPSWHLVKQRKI